MLRSTLRKMIPRNCLPSVALERYLRSLTENGTRVVRGPFRGLSLRSESYFSPIYNKLLGAYERELHGVLEQVIATSPAVIVDIGAAEGYYACGFAMRCGERTQHIAFESDFRSRFVLRRNLDANDLASKVTVCEHCSVSELARVIASAPGGVFILCDVEGMEGELLDPKLVPELIDATILVELHEFAVRGIGSFLKHRFRSSHEVRELASEPRSIEDLTGGKAPWWTYWLPRTTVARFASERPGGQSWLLFTPNASLSPVQDLP